MKRLNIAIIGLGNIGSYLFKFLNENRRILSEKNNCTPVITYVSAKNKKRNRGIKIKKSQARILGIETEFKDQDGNEVKIIYFSKYLDKTKDSNKRSNAAYNNTKKNKSQKTRNII